MPELGELTWPERGGRAEVDSLLLQAERHVVGYVPTLEERECVLRKVCETYPKTRVPWYFEGETHRLTRGDIIRRMDFLNQKSSPGLPWAHLGETKGVLRQRYAHMIADAVLQRLERLQSMDLSIEWDPRALIDHGLCDPIRLFVKNEPHSKEKANEKRWRLISSVSIVDELIERFLCSPQNEKEIDNWQDCPSKPGIGLSLDDQAQELFDSVLPHLSTAAEADVSGWDWSVKWWMFEMEIEARIRLCGASPASAFARLLKARIYCLARSVFSSSDGHLFMQTVPGVMKSGSYLTSSSNSRMRVMAAYLIGADWAIAMGDDSLETSTPNAIERYAALGIKVKMFRECQGSFEFCSHRFVDGVAVPINWAKGLYRLLSTRIDLERLVQFQFEFRHSPMLSKCMSVISERVGSSENHSL